MVRQNESMEQCFKNLNWELRIQGKENWEDLERPEQLRLGVIEEITKGTGGCAGRRAGWGQWAGP